MIIAGDFLDFQEEARARRSAQARQRNAGNFPPYYVRRASPFGRAKILYRFKWSIYEEWSDMSSVSPWYYAIGPFWSFDTACSIALRLQQARLDLVPHKNVRAKREGLPE